MGRNLYLKSVSIEEAHHLFNRIKQTQMKYVKTEIIDTKDAYDRVLSEAIFAQKSVPAFPSAAMDGIAIASSLTQKASDHHPLLLNRNDKQRGFS
jgi:putative molybdopterin biosynthesis protein